MGKKLNKDFLEEMVTHSFVWISVEGFSVYCLRGFSNLFKICMANNMNHYHCCYNNVQMYAKCVFVCKRACNGKRYYLQNNDKLSLLLCIHI